MSKNPRLTFDEHQDLGGTLANLRDELLTLAVTLDGAYPRSGPNSVAARKLRAAYEAVDEARSALDSALFREHPDTADPGIYYPAQRRHSQREAICTAEGTKRVAGEELVVICNLKPHDDPDHHDVIQGDWSGPGDPNPLPGPQI